MFSTYRNEIFCTLYKWTGNCPFGGWLEGPRENSDHNRLVSILRLGILVWRKGCCCKAEVSSLSLKNANTEWSSLLRSSMDKQGHPQIHRYGRAGSRVSRGDTLLACWWGGPIPADPSGSFAKSAISSPTFALEPEPRSLEEGVCFHIRPS